MQQAPLKVEGDQALEGKAWPKEGAIEFKDYSTRYRKELELVVQDFNIVIKGGEKVSLVCNKPISAYCTLLDKLY